MALSSVMPTLVPSMLGEISRAVERWRYAQYYMKD